MYFYAGDKVVDSTGKEFFDGTKPEDVQWPIKLYHAPADWVSLDYGIYRTTGPYKLEGKFNTPEEFENYQRSQW